MLPTTVPLIIKYASFQLVGSFLETHPAQAQLFPVFIPATTVLRAKVCGWLSLLQAFTLTSFFSKFNLVAEMESTAYPLNLTLKEEQEEEEIQSRELEDGPADMQKVRICSEGGWVSRKGWGLCTR